jgi:Rieske Fe-S protein
MRDAPRSLPSTFSRRAFLAAGLPLAVACTRTKEVAAGPRPLSLPLERFPAGSRVTVSVSGHPVEVVRSGRGVFARSLLCTHQGCEVAWAEAERSYLCPCHEGKFDEEGRPREGPPPSPLRAVPARVEGATLLLGP